jgi:hypothetical protein
MCRYHSLQRVIIMSLLLLMFTFYTQAIQGPQVMAEVSGEPPAMPTQSHRSHWAVVARINGYQHSDFPDLAYAVDNVRHMPTAREHSDFLSEWELFLCNAQASKHADSSKRSLTIVGVNVIDDKQVIKEFQNLSPDKTKQNGFPMIDIKLLNQDINTVYLKSLVFNIRKFFYKEKHIACSPLAPTWNYNIFFDPETNIESIQLEISQILKPGEPDRFVIIVGQKWDGSAEYEFDLILQFNDRESLFLGQHRLRIDGPPCGIGERLQYRRIMEKISR